MVEGPLISKNLSVIEFNFQLPIKIGIKFTAFFQIESSEKMRVDAGSDLKTIGPADPTFEAMKNFKNLFEKSLSRRVTDGKENPSFGMGAVIQSFLNRKIEPVKFTALLINPKQPGNPVRW